MNAKLVVLLMVLSSTCKENDQNHNLMQNKELGDSLRLVQLLSFNDTKSTSFFLHKDTVILFKFHDGTNKFKFARNFFFDSTMNRFEFNANMDDDKVIGLTDILSRSTDLSFLKSIGEVGKLHDSIPNKLKSIYGSTNSANLKVRTYQGRYFIIGNLFPRKIDVYNITKDELSSYKLTEDFYEVLGMLLCDIDHDNQPEIVIFNEGKVPREDVISYSIFSLRNDSIQVIYK